MQDFQSHHEMPSLQDVNTSGENKKRYAKLTPELKEEFLKKIIFNNMTIKQASELLRINYSSAKAILSLHKKTSRSTPRKITQKLAAKTTCFQDIGESKRGNGIVSMCSMVGGLVVSEQHFVGNKTKFIKKPWKG